jgi:hypothetical protein
MKLNISKFDKSTEANPIPFSIIFSMVNERYLYGVLFNLIAHDLVGTLHLSEKVNRTSLTMMMSLDLY